MGCYALLGGKHEKIKHWGLRSLTEDLRLHRWSWLRLSRTVLPSLLSRAKARRLDRYKLVQSIEPRAADAGKVTLSPLGFDSILRLWALFLHVPHSSSSLWLFAYFCHIFAGYQHQTLGKTRCLRECCSTAGGLIERGLSTPMGYDLVFLPMTLCLLEMICIDLYDVTDALCLFPCFWSTGGHHFFFWGGWYRYREVLSPDGFILLNNLRRSMNVFDNWSTRCLFVPFIKVSFPASTCWLHLCSNNQLLTLCSFDFFLRLWCMMFWRGAFFNGLSLSLFWHVSTV